jgi:hypothetical protein
MSIIYLNASVKIKGAKFNELLRFIFHLLLIWLVSLIN